MQKDITADEFGDIFVDCLTRKTTIVELSQYCGYTIAQTSRELAKIAASDSRYIEVFKKLKWPINISIGHIYVGNADKSTGSLALPAAERADLPILSKKRHKPTKKTLRNTVFRDDRKLNPYDYVIAEKIHTKSAYELFEAIAVKQLLFKIGKDVLVKNKKGQIKTKFKIKTRVWLSKKAVDRGRLMEICKDYNCTEVKVSPTNSRIIYCRGRWLGTVNKKQVVSVNYDWK